MAADEKNAEDEVPADVRQYRFGKGNLRVKIPSNYPTGKEAKAKPSKKLKLHYCQGYSGADKRARSNLYLSKDGNSLIYYMASVGIVLNLENNQQKFFRQHNDDVTCIAADPRDGSTLVATGQKDPKDRPGQGKDMPKIYVWDYTSMKKVKLIDNVCWGAIGLLQWSSNGILYMIGGDPDQTLKAWDANINYKELISQNTMKEEIFGFQINKNVAAYEQNVTDGIVDELVLYGNSKYSYIALKRTKRLEKDAPLDGKLRSVATSKFQKGIEKAYVCAEFLSNDGMYAVGATSGRIYLNQGQSCISVIDGHTKCVGDMIWDSEKARLISCGFDKCIKKFKIINKDKKKPTSLKETTSMDVAIKNSPFALKPKAMTWDKANNLLYIGCKTNQIVKYNFNGDDQKEACTSMVMDGHDNQVWGLACHPKNTYYATAGHDNKVKIWDAATTQCVFSYEFDKTKKFCCASWSKGGGCVVFGTEDSHFAVFRWYNDKETAVFEQLVNIPPKKRNSAIEPISNLRFSEDGSLLAVAHMDSNVYIYSVKAGNDGKYAFKKWKDALSCSAAPTHVQWTVDRTLVKAFTRDYEIVHWALNLSTKKATFEPNVPSPDKTKWSGDPLIAGWEVEGCFQDGWDGTDLNDVALSHDGKLIASGDDYGLVRLHNYPAVDKSACDMYSGHAEFVVGVQFTGDDSQLISVGGADNTIFQWKIV